MPTQWTFLFVGGAFDGYRHVADPRQIMPFQEPPEELHLWEADKRTVIREEGHELGIDNTAERYCLKGVARKQLEATYEHERLRPSPQEQTLREELDQAVPAAA